MKKIFCNSRHNIPPLKKLKSALPSAALRECVPLSDLTESLLCAYEKVARLAYENSRDRGDQRRCEVADWLAAEHEILSQIQLEIAEVAVGIESRCLLIFCSHESEDRADKDDLARSLDPSCTPWFLNEDSTIIFDHASLEAFPARSANMDYPASHLFCMLELPAEVDSARCTAILSNGLLGIHMPKVVAKSAVEFPTRTE